jgi:hypothetical protein
VPDANWDHDLHREVIVTLQRLGEALEVEEEGGEWPEDVVTPSGWPYCGCEDCLVREILTIAVPRIVEAYQQGLVDIS